MTLWLHMVLILISSVLSDVPFFLTGNWRNIHVNYVTKSNTAQPCVNFYKYACTKWKSETTKPDFELSWNHFTAASYKMKRKIQHILELPLDIRNTPLYKAQQFYNVCVHFEERQDQYLNNLRVLIDNLKGWPIIEADWYGEGYDWLETIALITKKLGLYPVLKFNVGIDYKNPDKCILYIDPGNLVFPQNILLNPKEFPSELEAYEKWISNSIRHIFPKNHFLMREVRQIVNFEKTLAKFMTIKSKMERNSLEHLSNKFNLKLSKLYEILFGRKFNSSYTIVIKNYEFFKNTVAFLKRTPKRETANYLIWIIVKEFSRDISSYLKKLNFSIDKTVLGFKSDISRETECINKVMEHFSFAILPKFLNLYFSTDVVRSVQDISQNIKTEFLNLLMRNTWLTNTTRNLALKKVKNIHCIVGFSDWMNNKTEVEQYYEMVNITEDHFKNLVTVKQFKAIRNFALIEAELATPLWPSNIFDVNAYYSILQNLVFVPLGILQEPFYHEQGPRIFNYGALGSLIGHEFSHSLDITGRQANANGKITKWWPNEDISGYLQRSKCFEDINQSANFLSIGESMADNIGLDISYTAYKKANDIELEEIFLNIQNEKVFFLSYAQMWCEISDQLDFFTDEHTSVEVRVNQAITNNYHFNRIFDCNTENQPEHICKLW